MSTADQLAREFVTVYLDQSDPALFRDVVLGALAEAREDPDLHTGLVSALVNITARTVITIANQRGMTPAEAWQVIAARLSDD